MSKGNSTHVNTVVNKPRAGVVNEWPVGLVAPRWAKHNNRTIAKGPAPTLGVSK